MSTPNVFADGPWDLEAERTKLRGRFVGRAAGARELGAAVYVLEPGSPGFDLHAHYAIEEMFVVLEGRPSLRAPDGERQLAPGDVVSCPRGPAGLHTVANRTEEPARGLHDRLPGRRPLPGAREVRRRDTAPVRGGARRG